MTFGLGENFAFLISRQTNKTNKQTVNKQTNISIIIILLQAWAAVPRFS
jgi:hypothetical protein